MMTLRLLWCRRLAVCGLCLTFSGSLRSEAALLPAPGSPGPTHSFVAGPGIPSFPGGGGLLTVVGQPPSQTVEAGGTATFLVQPSRSGPLTYSWFKDRAVIEGATERYYSILRVDPHDAGSYHVQVSDGITVAASSPAQLTVTVPPLPWLDILPGDLINVDFGASEVSGKVGMAAAGKGPSDFWNAYNRRYLLEEFIGFGSVPNLRKSDGTVTLARLEVANGPGAYGNGSTDFMYDGYLYSFDGQDTEVAITDLTPGSYDLYLYGHGGPGVDEANTLFEVSVEGVSQGTQKTTQGPGWLAPLWVEGQQYVLFRNLVVPTGHPVKIRVAKDGYREGYISGLQLVRRGGFKEILPGSILNVDFGAEAVSRKQGPAAIGFALNDFWNAYERRFIGGEYIGSGTVPNLRLADGAVTGVSLAVSNAPGAWGSGLPDPMYDGYLYSFDGQDSWVYLNGLTPGTYQLYLYGHGGPGIDVANTLFEVFVNGVSQGSKATTQGPGWLQLEWAEGQQYVVFRNLEVVAGAEVRVRVAKDGYLQGYLNGLQLQRVESEPAVVEIGPGDLVNVDLASAPVSSKRGPAAIGVGADDFWNAYERRYVNGEFIGSGVVTNLRTSAGAITRARLAVTNAPGAFGNGSTDPMFDGYLYSFDGQDSWVYLNDLTPGRYDLYLYGHAGSGVDAANTLFETFVGGVSLGQKATTQGPGWIAPLWVEGQQYVVFRDFDVAAGAEVRVRVAKDGYREGYINGLQLRRRTPLAPRAPEIHEQPRSTAVEVGGVAEFAVAATGSGPLTYRWFLEGVALPGETGSRLVFSGVTLVDAGRYEVEVSNSVGTVRSDVAVLAVLVPPTVQRASVYFANRITGIVDAPVFDVDGVTRLVGPGYVAQLYGGPTPTNLVAAGASAPFRTGVAAGYWDAGDDGHRDIPGVRPGEIAYLQVRVWDRQLATSFEAAVAAGLVVGESAIFTAVTGGAGNPPTFPANLTQLRSFGLAPAVAPQIVRLTGDAEVSAGNLLRLTVEAIGSHLQYQWYHDGNPVAGARSSVYEVPSVTVTDQGAYFVRVSNALGEATSRVIQVSFSSQRRFRLQEPDPVQEGLRVHVPLLLSGAGGVAGGSLVVRYDPATLADPDLTWISLGDGGVAEWRSVTAGELRLVFALANGGLPAGDFVLARIGFRARSVPAAKTTRVELEVSEVSDTLGDSIRDGTAVEGADVRVLPRRLMGDNNGNDRLDIGDARIVLGLLVGADAVRDWDVTGNDLNHSATLDSGDAVKILRVAAGLDAGPTVHAIPRLAATQSPWDAAEDTAIARLNVEPTTVVPGAPVRVMIQAAAGTPAVSGAAFRLTYDPQQLRVVSTRDLRTGSSMPGSVLPLWNLSPQNDVATQSGEIRFAASGPDRWPVAGQTLAEVAFQVPAGAAIGAPLPVTLEWLEVTTDGYTLLRSAGLTAAATVREPVPTVVAGLVPRTADAWTVRLTGEPGTRQRLEVSSDLIHWTVAGVARLGEDGAVMDVRRADGAGAWFFRAVAEP